MNLIANFQYFGELAALSAALFWSIAIILFKSVSNELSPFLITAIKNTIGLISFILLFIILDFPVWHSKFDLYDYIKIIVSGVLGMGLADALFIFALTKIGANRVGIINCFEPVVIYMFSFIMLGTYLTIQQLLGFVIVILAILIINYEKDIDDINPRVKSLGLFLQILAVLLSSFGIVLIKPVLAKVDGMIYGQLWVTAFRLFPGFIFAWVLFLFQKDKYVLLYPLKNFNVIKKISLGSFLGTFMALGFWILGYANINKPPIASILNQSAMIFIVIFSWLFLKENITKLRFLSIMLAIIGVCVTIL